MRVGEFTPQGGSGIWGYFLVSVSMRFVYYSSSQNLYGGLSRKPTALRKKYKLNLDMYLLKLTNKVVFIFFSLRVGFWSIFSVKQGGPFVNDQKIEN